MYRTLHIAFHLPKPHFNHLSTARSDLNNKREVNRASLFNFSTFFDFLLSYRGKLSTIRLLTFDPVKKTFTWAQNKL